MKQENEISSVENLVGTELSLDINEEKTTLLKYKIFMQSLVGVGFIACCNYFNLKHHLVFIFTWRSAGLESQIETWEDEEDEYLAHEVYEHMRLDGDEVYNSLA